LVFSWVTTANATTVASITNLNGDIKIDGFSSLTSGGDNDPLTVNFWFHYKNGGTANFFQPIIKGNFYNVTFDSAHIDLGELFSGPFKASFGIESPSDIDHHSVSMPIDAILGQLLPFSVSGSPLGSLSFRGNTLDLLSVTATVPPENTTLKLVTQVTRGTDLNRLLNNLDQDGNGSLTGTFTDANLTVVPEPTAFLLLGCGLLGMFGFSKSRLNT
jgi:hypothetical protein